MKPTFAGLLALSILAGCNEATDTAPVAQGAPASAKASSCVTTGPESPIVTGEKSVVVINGKSHTPGQVVGCDPSSSSVSTHGAGSPIVTGAGAKVINKVER